MVTLNSEDKIIKVNFEKPTDDYKKAESLVRQWDKGQYLQITGLDLPEKVQIHFSLNSHKGEASKVWADTVDGVTTAAIPANILEAKGITGSSYCAYAFIYLTDEESAKTVKKIILEVESRPRPEDYIYTPEDIKTWEDHEQRISNIEKNGSSGSLKPLTIQIGNEKLEYDGSGAVTITIPDGTLAKVEKDSTDTVLEMTGDFSKYYVFPEMEELTVTGEGDFFFQSGETPTTLTLEDTVKVPDSFTVESNKVYEINILNGCMTYQSWAVE